MPDTIHLEQIIVSGEYYFANLMNKVVDDTLELNPVQQGFIEKVDGLYYAIEALKFLVDRGIDTSNETCMGAYNTLMSKLGVNTGLPNQTKDESLILLFKQ